MLTTLWFQSDIILAVVLVATLMLIPVIYGIAFKHFKHKSNLIKTRLPSQYLLRLHLTTGFIVIMCAALLFTLIAKNVMADGALTIVDVQIAQWLHQNSASVVTKSLLILTHLHDPIVISVIVLLMALWLIWKKRIYEAVTILLVVQGGMLLNLLVKHLFQRPRPRFSDPLITLTTYSFPSGHVVASTLFYGVLAALLIAQISSRVRTISIFLIAFVMVVLVAFSRLYLGAHYLSDVLAAFIEAIAWLALCFTVIQTYRIYHKNKY